MDPRSHVGLEISAYIRKQATMPWKLQAFLTLTAVRSVRLELDELPENTPAHRAFEIMTTAAQQRGEAALREKVAASRALTNILRDCHEDPDDWYRTCARRGAESAMVEARKDFTTRYGFVVTDEAVSQLAGHIADLEALEVGSGNGYLAHRLNQAGISVLPTDANLPQQSGYHLGSVQHTDIINIDARTAIQELPEMDLLWSWPCPGDSSGQALQHFRGKTLIYIGDQYDGCTGGKLFHQLLDQRFKPVDFIPIPSFSNVHDCIGVYRRC